MPLILASAIIRCFGISAIAASVSRNTVWTGGGSSSVTMQDAALTWVTVFTWPGGDEGNDIRNSAPSTLSGGH